MNLPPELQIIPWHEPWAPVSSPQFESRLAEECGPHHVLYRRPAVSIGRRLDDDDVLFYLPGGPALLAVVHLTYSTRMPEPDSRFPYTRLYSSVREWIDQCLLPDAHDGQHS